MTDLLLSPFDGGVSLPVSEHDESVVLAVRADTARALEARSLSAASSAARRRPLEPNEKKRARRAIANYLERCERQAARWHYSQARPMSHLGVAPEKGGTCDCSGNATGAFYWARNVTGLPVEDPNGLAFNGFGYTGTLLAENRDCPVPVGRRYFVGDLALYGPASATRHVVVCRKGGTAEVAVWTSHGSEAGPYPVRLRYRSDLLGVYRPWSLR